MSPRRRSSNRIVIHEGLETDDCLKILGKVAASDPPDGVDLAPKLQSPVNVSSPDSSHSASGAATPREVWVDSKERLSEMATNIRGISTALSKVSIALKVQNVLIITKLSDETLSAKTREMAEWLLKSKYCREEHLKVSVQDVFKTRPSFDYEGLVKTVPQAVDSLLFWSSKTINRDPQKYDLAITLGGDGTVLFASWLFQEVVPPVLSFSLGSLSFMTEHKYSDFPATLTHNLENGISAALRMRFTCTIMRTRNPEKNGVEDLRDEILAASKDRNFHATHKAGEHYSILNEVVVDRGPNPVMVTTELFGNFEYLTSVTADGVVISTPSGSTAYSMSAGGSLAHPDVPAALVTPISPHSLSFRPLVLPDSMILQVGVPYDARAPAFASFDGKKRVELRRGDFLVITASRYPFPKIIHTGFTSATWVRQLGESLHWNEQRRPKRLT